jgi:hypothetical protein
MVPAEALAAPAVTFPDHLPFKDPLINQWTMNRTLLIVLTTFIAGTMHGQAGTSSGTASMELVSFEAGTMDASSVQVRFATMAERPGERFRVERSRDLLQWELVADLEGNGAGNGYSPYTVVDDAPISGVSYYRLMVREGAEWNELSDLFSIRHEASEGLSIRPEQRPGRFSVLAQGTLAQVTILNNRGQFVPMDLQQDGDRVIVNTELLENGTYYVQATVNGIQLMRPIVVHAGSIVGG